jgi:3-hydroxyisobutyrate dehydrogenase-like beta-hydroxyacid dehydrogenase
MRVGFIGLGSQGAGMAQRLIDCGISMTLWARREASLEPFRGTTARFAKSPAALGAESDLVSICVVDDAGVEQVLLGEQGVLAGMQPGGVIAVHSTIHPSTIERIVQEVRARGVSLVDAPVSGGDTPARQGKLGVMAGCDDETYERCLPVLSKLGDVIRTGSPGTGQLAKLVNNVLMTAHLALADDALALGEALGIDERALVQILCGGSGTSFALQVWSRREGRPGMIAQGAPMLRKDAGIIARVAAEHSAPLGSLLEVADRALRIMNHPREEGEP